MFDYSKITEKSGVVTDYWTDNLWELIMRKANINKAYKKVKSNKGSGGIDGMQVGELLPCLIENQEILIQEIRDGRYGPNPVRRVEIPKETKGEYRKLGVPTKEEHLVRCLAMSCCMSWIRNYTEVAHISKVRYLGYSFYRYKGKYRFRVHRSQSQR